MKKNEKGFTLVELMIVVAIIAILAAVALPAFGTQIKKSKDAKAVQMMGSMRSQLSMVQADLEGAAPTIQTCDNMFNDKGGDVRGGDGSNVESKGIQGFNKMATIATSGLGSMNAGFNGTTGTVVPFSYTNADGKLQFTGGTNKDSKGKLWSSY